jgi:hypothetical protein
MTTYNKFLTAYANTQDILDVTGLINSVKRRFKKITGLSINADIQLNDLYDVIQSLWLVRESVAGLYELSVALENFKTEMIADMNIGDDDAIVPMAILNNNSNMNDIEVMLLQVTRSYKSLKGQCFTVSEIIDDLANIWQFQATDKFLSSWLKLRGYKKISNGLYKCK